MILVFLKISSSSENHFTFMFFFESTSYKSVQSPEQSSNSSITCKIIFILNKIIKIYNANINKNKINKNLFFGEIITI